MAEGRLQSFYNYYTITPVDNIFGEMLFGQMTLGAEASRQAWFGPVVGLEPRNASFCFGPSLARSVAYETQL